MTIDYSGNYAIVLKGIVSNNGGVSSVEWTGTMSIVNFADDEYTLSITVNGITIGAVGNVSKCDSLDVVAQVSTNTITGGPVILKSTFFPNKIKQCCCNVRKIKAAVDIFSTTTYSLFAALSLVAVRIN